MSLSRPSDPFDEPPGQYWPPDSFPPSFTRDGRTIRRRCHQCKAYFVSGGVHHVSQDRRTGGTLFLCTSVCQSLHFLDASQDPSYEAKKVLYEEKRRMVKLLTNGNGGRLIRGRRHSASMEGALSLKEEAEVHKMMEEACPQASILPLSGQFEDGLLFFKPAADLVDLKAFVAYRESSKVPLLARICMAQGLVVAVSTIHDMGYVHQRIDFGNVFVSASFLQDPWAVLAGFSHTRHIASLKPSDMRQRCGTLCSAPELSLPYAGDDGRSLGFRAVRHDVFALATCVMAILAMAVPYEDLGLGDVATAEAVQQGWRPKFLNPLMPDFGRWLAPEPEDRASVQDLSDALTALREAFVRLGKAALPTRPPGLLDTVGSLFGTVGSNYALRSTKTGQGLEEKEAPVAPSRPYAAIMDRLAERNDLWNIRKEVADQAAQASLVPSPRQTLPAAPVIRLKNVGVSSDGPDDVTMASEDGRADDATLLFLDASFTDVSGAQKPRLLVRIGRAEPVWRPFVKGYFRQLVKQLADAQSEGTVESQIMARILEFLGAKPSTPYERAVKMLNTPKVRREFEAVLPLDQF